MASDRSTRLLVTGLLVLIIVALTWWLSKSYEWKEVTLDMGWSPEAARQPYLAAKKFIESDNISVELLTRVPSSKEIRAADSIFLVNADFMPLDSQHHELLEWLDSGGHLIIGLSGISTPRFLSRLGFNTEYETLSAYEHGELDENEAEEKEKSLADRLRDENERIRERESEVGDAIQTRLLCRAPLHQCNELDEPELDSASLIQLSFEGDEKKVFVHSRNAAAISHPQTHSDIEFESDLIDDDDLDKLNVFYWGGDENGVRFVQADYGQGLLTVVNDSEMFSSSRIGHFDHAYLWHVLVSTSSKVLVLEGKNMSALSTLLWRYYREALVAFLLILIFSYWRFSVRFGALKDVITSARRSREEGMRAIGQWHWRRSESQLLLVPLRERVFELASMRWPGFKKWSQQDQQQEIASYCNIDIALVSEALAESSIKDEQRFLSIVKNLQKIRKAL